MSAKRLKAGEFAYYWEPRKADRTAGFTLPAEALGRDYAAARARAIKLNGFLDDWRANRGAPATLDTNRRVGTVDWWIESYLRSEACTRLSARSQSDYAEALRRLAEVTTKVTSAATGAPGRVGDLPVSSLSPAAVDKLYARLRQGGRITRTANYSFDVARIAWRVVSRTHPGLFLIPIATPEGRRPMPMNPFVGVVRTHSRGTTKPASREQAIQLADALAQIGHPALGVVALVAFEWLQRPENVIAGHLKWGQYRPGDRPGHVEIFHHKTGARIWQPLEADGRPLFPELEARLAALPRVADPMVVLIPQRGRAADGERQPRTYSESHADHLVAKARKLAGLPSHVTLAACRHGGMTELGDAGLTEQSVMALSGHKTPNAARLYVKRTETQRLAAATQRKRYVDGR